MPVGGGHHGPRFGQVARHPRLTEHVLAGVKRRDGDSRVHVRRRADPDHVDVGVVDDLAPVIADARNAELHGEGLGRLAAPVADGDDFDVWESPQPRHVPLAHDIAGAHDPDPHYF